MTSPSAASAGSPIACPTGQALVPAGDAWSLVTAPDEQERCCVIIRNERCDHATAYRVSGKDGALDDYTYVCKCHLELVRGLDDTVTFIAS